MTPRRWAALSSPQASGPASTAASWSRGSDGGTCPREFLDKVEQEIFQQASTEAGPFEVADLTSPYVRALAEFVGGPAIRPLKVVVDPMYGSATGVLADLVRSLGHEVIEIHAKKLEDFDGIHPDPKDPWADACEQEVVAAGADLGILVDGDGDRAAAVDEYGNILAVRELTPLLLSYIGGELGMRGRVVTTLTCSASVELEAQKLGFEYASVPVGFGRSIESCRRVTSSWARRSMAESASRRTSRRETACW